MIAADLDALLETLEFVSSGISTEHRAYVSLDTGAIYWVSESGDLDDDAPEDLEESDRYLAIPSKADLGLGSSIALRFAENEIPHEYQTVRRFFAGRGAFARFKDFLAAQGRLEAWYACEAACTEQAVCGWCEARDIKAILRARGQNHTSA